MSEKFKIDIDPLLVRFAIALAALGALVSFLSSLIAGAGFVGILLQPVIMALVMAAIGSGIYYLVSHLYPEMVAQVRSIFLPMGGEAEMSDGLDDLAINDDIESFTSEGNEESISETDLAASDGSVLATPGSKSSRASFAKEGEILVEGVPIKNEPKLMAEAIQHLLDQDED